MNKYFSIATFFLAMLFLSALQWSSFEAEAKKQDKQLPRLVAVEKLDPEKFSGDWTEIALIPYSYQKMCVKDSRVRYTLLQPMMFEDYFECKQLKGTLKKYVGRLKIPDPNRPGVMKATFLNLLGWRFWFGENYWVIALADDYRYAVIGHPSRKYGWVFSRKQTLDAEDKKRIATILQSQGYDLSKFKVSPQTDGLNKREPYFEEASQK